MKKLLLTLSLAAACLASHAQTNNFPSSGSVGIGTNTPATLLEVSSGNVSINDPTSAAVRGLFFTPSDNSLRNYVQALSSSTVGNDYLQIGSQYGALDFSVGICTSPTSAMHILNNRNIGIGTSSPLDKLDIAGTSSTPGRVVFGDGGNFTPYMKSFKWTGSGTNYYQTTIINSSDAGGALSFQTGIGGAAIGSDAQTTRMIITRQGNVGIGTTNPQGYLLAVNGSAIATSFTVKTYTNWPDYVFQPGYKLQDLDDVKAYIDLHHHLPDVPSQQKVEKQGQNLGEMNKLLLKKVEELTLYLIEKDKELKQEQAQNMIQENKLDAFGKDIEVMKQQIDKMAKQLSK